MQEQWRAHFLPRGMLSQACFAQGLLRYFFLPRSFPYLNSSFRKFKLILAHCPAIFLAFAPTRHRQQSFGTSLVLCMLTAKSSCVPCCVSDITPASQVCPLAKPVLILQGSKAQTTKAFFCPHSTHRTMFQASLCGQMPGFIAMFRAQVIVHTE